MICTFYSYGGGVGRSMALANVAELFYMAGLKVMMVDWDLEKPGLEKFFFKDAEEQEFLLNSPGVMDLLQDYKNKMSQDLTISVNEELPFQKPEDIAISIHPKSSGKGELYLLTAGRRSKGYFSEYANSVLNFDWHDFYDNWQGEFYFEWLRRRLELSADITLIDSRTGVTEMGGVCIYQFADVVVMFCAPNKQSLEGTKKMASNFVRPSVQKLRPERVLNLIIVPSRVDTSKEASLLDKFYKSFAENFSRFVPKELKIEDVFARDFDLTSINKIAHEIEPFWKLTVPEIPYYSFEECLTVRKAEIVSETLTDAYGTLAKAILRFSLDPKEISKLIEKF